MESIKHNKTNLFLVMLGALILNFVVVGLTNGPNSLYQVPVTEFYGFSRASFSIVLSLFQIATMLENAMFSVLLRRLGIRGVLMLGGICICSAFLLFSVSATLPLFYLAGLLLGFGFGCCFTPTSTVIVRSWVHEKQGLAMGLVFAGSGLGGTVFCYLIGRVIERLGFQTSYRISAVIIVVSMIAVLFLVEDPPASLASQAEAKKGNKGSALSLRQALKQPTFLCATVTVLLMGLTIHPIATIIPNFLADKSFDVSFAATVVSVMYFASAVGKLGLGVLCDRYGIFTSMFLLVLTMVTGLFVLLIAKTPSAAIISALIYGISIASQTVLIPLFIACFLKNEDYNNFIGFFFALLTGGGALGIFILNFLFDLSSSYASGVIISILVGVGILIVSTVTIRKAGVRITLFKRIPQAPIQMNETKTGED